MENEDEFDDINGDPNENAQINNDNQMLVEKAFPSATQKQEDDDVNKSTADVNEAASEIKQHEENQQSKLNNFVVFLKLVYFARIQRGKARRR